MLKLSEALTGMATSLAKGVSSMLSSAGSLSWKTVALGAAALGVAAGAIYLTSVAA